MNKHEIQGKWEQVKAKLKQEYADMTDDEILKFKADSQKLAGFLQEKYGVTKEQAEKEAASLKDLL
jgi:uncharacterized protein YjbJ (UPF0337 family)